MDGAGGVEASSAAGGGGGCVGGDAEQQDGEEDALEQESHAAAETGVSSDSPSATATTRDSATSRGRVVGPLVRAGGDL